MFELVKKKSDYHELSKHVLRFRKKIDVYVQFHVFSGSDLIPVLSFSGKLKNACNLNSVPRFTAVRCFPFCMEGQAELLMLTAPAGRCDGCGLQTIQNVADTEECGELFASSICNE